MWIYNLLRTGKLRAFAGVYKPVKERYSVTQRINASKYVHGIVLHFCYCCGEVEPLYICHRKGPLPIHVTRSCVTITSKVIGCKPWN